MNTYLIYTQSGAAYVVRASYSFEAEARVLAFSGERAACWFIGQPAPRGAITLN